MFLDLTALSLQAKRQIQQSSLIQNQLSIPITNITSYFKEFPEEHPGEDVYLSLLRASKRRQRRKKKKSILAYPLNVHKIKVTHIIFDVFKNAANTFKALKQLLVGFIFKLIKQISEYIRGKWAPSIKKIRKERNKYTVSQQLFFYSPKLLKVKRKQMLLVNMKNTPNNFWGWVRTQQIFFIPKQNPITNRELFKERLKLRINRQLHKLQHATNRMHYLTVRNQRRMERKQRWFRRQHGLQRKYKEKYKNQKQYDKQQLEFAKYQRKDTMYQRGFNHFQQKLRKFPPMQKSSQLFLHFWGRFLERIVYFYKASVRTNALPDKQNFNDLFGLTFSDFMRRPFFISKKPTWWLRKRMRYSLKIVRKRYVPAKQYEPLKRQYKRNRRGLLKRITQILKEQEAAKYVLIMFNRRAKRALHKLKTTWQNAIAFMNINITAGNIGYTPQFMPSLILRPHTVFQNNITNFFNMLKNIPSRVTILPATVRDYVHNNLLEIKRIL